MLYIGFVIGILIMIVLAVQKQKENKSNHEFLQRINEPKMISCPVCGESVSSRARSCPKCGHPIDTKVYCPYCGSYDLKEVSGFTKGASAAAFGVFAANTIRSKYQCNHCRKKF